MIRLTHRCVRSETIIQRVLTADPNGVIAQVFDYLDANGYLITAYEDDDQVAAALAEACRS